MTSAHLYPTNNGLLTLSVLERAMFIVTVIVLINGWFMDIKRHKMQGIYCATAKTGMHILWWEGNEINNIEFIIEAALTHARESNETFHSGRCAARRLYFRPRIYVCLEYMHIFLKFRGLFSWWPSVCFTFEKLFPNNVPCEISFATFCCSESSIDSRWSLLSPRHWLDINDFFFFLDIFYCWYAPWGIMIPSLLPTLK